MSGVLYGAAWFVMRMIVDPWFGWSVIAGAVAVLWVGDRLSRR